MYSKVSQEIVEGTFVANNKARATYNANSKINLRPMFRRFVVYEVLFAPKIIDDVEENILFQKFGEIKNISYAKGRVLPRNTIIAKELFDITRDNHIEASNLMLVFPFFASHIGLPCKPGEHVWVMFENIVDPGDIGYWFGRIVGFDHIDDVNHSHSPREYDQLFNFLGSSDATTPPRYHFKNGVFMYSDDSTDRESSSLLSSPYIKDEAEKNSEDAYENIILNSNASKLIPYEPVPRFKKRPGDLALEGSNNSLIVLGHERADFTDNAVTSAASSSEYTKNAATIDMVVGRGSSQDTLGNSVINELRFSEVDKFGLNLKASEGDPDYNLDRSRILISQRTKPDLNFSISGHNEEKFKLPSVKDSDSGDAAIVLRTDKVRIIARTDIQFLVQSPVDVIDPVGNPIKNSSTDIKNWASITIKSNGDIVFTPSDMGYIKLGGDDANKGILCTATPVLPTNGGIAGQPIGNTAGGRMGGSVNPTPNGNSPGLDASTGTFSNKVLIK